MSSYNIGGFPTLDFDLFERDYKNDFLDGFKKLGLSGRTILKDEISKDKEIYIPKLMCSEVKNFLHQKGYDCVEYNINSNFEPLSLPSFTSKRDFILIYVNYFGVCGEVVKTLANTYGPHLIVDNTHNLYDESNSYTWFSSLRKWYGVPGGAVMSWCNNEKLIKGRFFSSYKTSELGLSHLVNNWDGSKQLEKFRANEEEISRLSLKENIKHGFPTETYSIMSSLNLETDKVCRRMNFAKLHLELSKMNSFKFKYPSDVPFSYPFINQRVSREFLVSRGIFVPNLWRGVNLNELNSFERWIAENMIILPINHTIKDNDVQAIVSVINEKAIYP